MNKQNPGFQKTVLMADPVPHMPWEEKPSDCKEVVWRDSRNPIIDLHPFPKARSVYNSCVIPWEDGFIGIFRVDWLCMTPYLHVGRSSDGVTWHIEEEPIKFHLDDSVPAGGDFSYDPRLCKIDDKYYITWCNTYFGATIGQAWTTDFKTFHQLENAFLPYNRNGVLFPKKISGKYAMLSRPMGLGMAVDYGDIFYSESHDLIYWGKHRNVFTRGPRKWERVKIGAGPVPIETSEGWLLIYHGVSDTCDGFVYSMGAVLLDLDQPWKVIYRCQFPLMTPEKIYETAGCVGNVVFPTGVLADGDTGRMAIYYGAADTYTAIAYAYIDEILAYVKEHAW